MLTQSHISVMLANTYIYDLDKKIKYLLPVLRCCYFFDTLAEKETRRRRFMVSVAFCVKK